VIGTDKADALAVAALLERWADEIPRWDVVAGERWDAFAERRYIAERTLKERLRRLPGCVLQVDDAGTQVDLMLAGIRAKSRICLQEACQVWAAEVRRLAEQ
jgi:hypothetical protein